MTSETGFSMRNIEKASADIPEIGIGMLGYAFMGKAHSNAYKKIPYMIYPPPAFPKLIAICGRNISVLEEAAKRYGYKKYYTDWKDMVNDKEIGIINNGGPNSLHAEPCMKAAENGKHVICEKPLGRNTEESLKMYEFVKKTGVKHMTAFNYRFVPAVVQMKKLLDSGALGRIYHFRAVYLQEWGHPMYDTPHQWRMNKAESGSGAIGDIGAHIIDLAHFLIGGIKSIDALVRTFIDERAGQDNKMHTVDIDDAFVATAEFVNGAIGTFEATRLAAGRKNLNRIEINGENGSIEFNLERLNELNVYWVNEEPAETRGFHNVMISEPHHPWWSHWWPQGHIIGWEHTFVHEFTHFLDCVVNNHDIVPYGADFYDGVRASVICDAISESSEKRRRIDIVYPGR